METWNSGLQATFHQEMETLTAFFSAVYGPTGTKRGRKLEGMCQKLNIPLVSMVTILLSCKLENALTAHMQAWWCWNFVCEVNYARKIDLQKMSEIYPAVLDISPSNIVGNQIERFSTRPQWTFDAISCSHHCKPNKIEVVWKGGGGKGFCMKLHIYFCQCSIIRSNPHLYCILLPQGVIIIIIKVM